MSYPANSPATGCVSGTPTTKAHAAYSASGGGNTYAYTYDCNGNVTQRTVNGTAYTLTYDTENRLTGVSGGATATFVYDGDGNRVKTTIAGTTTAYVGNYYELSGSAYKKYYYAGGQRVALSDNGTLKWLLGDHLGSTSLTANGTTGALLTELRYKPWGENRYTSGSTPTTYRFTGQRQEAALGGAEGLYDYGARWYDPATARFAQADSIVPDGDKTSIIPLTVDFHEPQFLAALNAENRYTLEHGFWFQLSTAEKREAKVQRGPLNPQALNRFSYVLGNPMRYTDPTGHTAACTANYQRCIGGRVTNNSSQDIYVKGDLVRPDGTIERDAIFLLPKGKSSVELGIVDVDSIVLFADADDAHEGGRREYLIFDLGDGDNWIVTDKSSDPYGLNLPYNPFGGTPQKSRLESVRSTDEHADLSGVRYLDSWGDVYGIRGRMLIGQERVFRDCIHVNCGLTEVYTRN